MNYWHHWRYKNITLVILGIFLALIISRVEAFHSFLIHLGGLGYFGAFIAGILFVNTFTVSTGALILLVLSEQISAVGIGLVAGLGAVIGDIIVFQFVKDDLVKELKFVYNKIDSKHHLIKLLHSKYFNWSLPVIGAIIIASPFPDELGVTLMGISKMKTYRFVLISYFLNSVGIFSVVSAAAVFRI